MQKWEYKLVPAKLTFLKAEKTHTEQLNLAGEEGWELVSVVGENVGSFFVFKRPKP